jgi:pimeloyl-ACP methyl ester carboxylesterase
MGQSIVKQFAFMPPPPSYDKTYPNVWISRTAASGDGDGDGARIPAVFVDAPAGARRRVPVTVLYTHGNAEDIGQMDEWMRHLAARLRVAVLFYDYGGYGLHCAPLSEAGCLRDAEACLAYLTRVRGVDPRCVVLMGRSLGSGPTTHLASTLCRAPCPALGVPVRGGVGGLVLQSALASCVRTVSRALALVPFTDKIDVVTVPTLLVHGRADGVVPYAHGQALWAKLPDSARFRFLTLDAAGHNDIEQIYYDELITTLSDFMDLVESRALAVTTTTTTETKQQ